MPINEFPYTNLHELNIDWILKIVKDFQTKYGDFDETYQEMLHNIEVAGSEAVEAVSADKDTALAAINVFLEQCISALDSATDAHRQDLSNVTNNEITAINGAGQNQRDLLAQDGGEYVEQMEALLAQVPSDYRDALNQLQIINSILNENYTYPQIIQGAYPQDSPPTYISAMDTAICTQAIAGCAGRTLEINITSGTGVIRQIVYWTGWASPWGGHWESVGTGQSPLTHLTYTFPIDATFFSIIFTHDWAISENISPSDITVDLVWHTPLSDRIDEINKSLMPYNAHDLIIADGTFMPGTHNGVTFAFNGSTITAVSGTANPNAFRNVIESINALPAGFVAGRKYKVQFSSGDNTKLRAWILYYKNGTNTSSTTIEENTDITIPADATGIVVRYYVPSGTTVSNISATLKIQSTSSNEELSILLNEYTEKISIMSNLWAAYINPGYELTAKFETDSGNNIWFSWESNLLSYLGRSVGWNLSMGAAAVGGDYSGTSPSGVANAIKIPAGYVFIVIANGDSRTLGVIPVADFDRTIHLALVYNRAGQIVSGEMLKYYLMKQKGDDNAVCLMPSKLRICGGREMNIYHQCVVRYDNPTSYKKIENSNRFSFGQYYSRYTPPVDANGTFLSTFKFFKYNDTADFLKKTLSVDLVPKTAGSGLTKKVLFIGDSMTDADHYPQEIVNLFSNDAMNVTLLGTLGTTTAPNEGRSGWRAYTYCRCANGSDDLPSLSYTNPFYNNGHFDFSKYMTDQGYSSVDYVFICLGTNDVAASRPLHSTDADIIEYWDEMIASIHTYDSNIKIALWLPPVASQMVNYNRAYMDSSMRAHDLIIRTYDNRESEKIYLCPVYMNIDPFHDYPYTMQNVSARNSNFQEAVGTDNVHPSQAGYNKCADVIYSLIKYFGSIDT